MGKVLQSRTTFIVKGGMNYKVGQLLESRAVQKANEGKKGGQQILATDSLIHCRFAWRQTVRP